MKKIILELSEEQAGVILKALTHSLDIATKYPQSGIYPKLIGDGPSKDELLPTIDTMMCAVHEDCYEDEAADADDIARDSERPLRLAEGCESDGLEDETTDEESAWRLSTRHRALRRWGF